MKTWITVAVTTAVLVGATSSAIAQSTQGSPVPGYQAAREVPGAKQLPDPSMTYKVVFDVAAAAPTMDDENPMLALAARYLNTLAEHGVPAENRQIAVVFHRGATEIILNNATFKARNEGYDNPNIALIQSLDRAGVDFHVCGQAVLGRDIDPDTIMPEIQLDLWALTTLIDLELQGYVRIGG